MTPTSRAWLGSALVLLLAGTGPAQDGCTNAIDIGNGFTTGSTVGMSTGVPVFACGTTNEVWYRYVAPCTGDVVVSLCAPAWAAFDTVLSAWEGFAGCGALGLLACNDDVCGTASAISFRAQGGKTYYITVGGYLGETGTFSMWVNCTPTGFSPANDFCAGAFPLTPNAPAAGTNTGATTGPDPAAPCVPSAGSDVWYGFYAPASGNYEVTTCYPSTLGPGATSFDTVLSVWTGSCSGLNLVACNDDECFYIGPGHSYNSTVTFTAVAFEAYYVSVSGYGGTQGDFVISLRPQGGMEFDFITRFSGELGYRIRGGPPNGPVLAAITLFPGAFPNGWFLGIDIGLSELAGEMTTFPFSTTLGSCGEFAIGPIGPIPTGLSFYGVSIATPPGADYVYRISPPRSVTVP